MSNVAVSVPLPDVAAVSPVRVAWLGPGRDDVPGIADLDVVTVAGAADVAAYEPRIVHVTDPNANLRAMRRAVPHALLVLDLSAEATPAAGRGAARRARAADRILVGSEAARRELVDRQPALASRVVVAPRPLDLERHAPLRQLSKIREFDTRIKRFRRIHRLAEPAILFVGPYTADGRLREMIELVYALREKLPQLRLAAIPDGEVDHRYLDDCEQLALGLGHHGIVEWQAPDADSPIWYALATLVVAPDARGAATGPARLAAAAGRPFVGTAGGAAEDVVVNGETGFIVPAADVATLHAAVEALVGDAEEAARLGSNARALAERELGADAAGASYVEQAWADGTRRLPVGLGARGIDRR